MKPLNISSTEVNRKPPTLNGFGSHPTATGSQAANVSCKFKYSYSFVIHHGNISSAQRVMSNY